MTYLKEFNKYIKMIPDLRKQDHFLRFMILGAKIFGCRWMEGINSRVNTNRRKNKGGANFVIVFLKSEIVTKEQMTTGS